MPTPLLIVVKAVNGGLFVALFAVLGEMLQPKRFAGIFGASPAVALANLLIIALAKGDSTARSAATGMIAGAIAMAVACTAAIPAVRRWGAIRGSAVLWGVWILVGGAIAVPVVGGASRVAGTGLPVGRRGRRQPRNGKDGRNGSTDGQGSHRLFSVDFGALREIRPGALAARFAFGAAVSIVAGLIGVVAGQRAGGVMLAAPAVLPATLTVIEKQEGRGPAVTEVKGAVLGAVALIGFALVTAASIAKLPLAAALICALVTWVVVAIGAYLAQSALFPLWHQDVRDLARQRHDATLVRRGQAGPSAPQPSGSRPD